MGIIHTSAVPSEEILMICRAAAHFTPRIEKNHIHNRSLSTLMLVHRGQYRYSFGQNSLVVHEGDLIYIPVGASYTYEIDSIAETEIYQIEMDVSHGADKVIFSEDPVVLHDPTKYLRLFDEIIHLYSSITPYYDFRITADLYLLMTDFSAISHAPKEPKSSRIYPAISYINSHYAEKVSIEHLARLCSLSESQLRRIFQEEIHLSPVAYKIKLRMDQACKLLRYSSSSIGEISSMLGFDNIYSFSNSFKHSIGLSPKEYRHSMDAIHY